MLLIWRSLLLAACLHAVLPAGAAAQPLDGSLDRPALEELEGLLRDLGFDPGPVDGAVDADTIEAIRQYQDFALLPGEPEPSERLLNELRGVAAAFAALNTRAPEPAAAEAAVPQEAPAPPLPVEPQEKVIVPPPPAPPKLAEATEPAIPEDPPAPPASPEPLDQTAALPPPDAAPEEEPGPAAILQARVEAELLPFLHRLQDGSLTRADLARQFNNEGRALLQQASYEEAIVKFSVAIHLDPDFAGAWSNRGTAWQHLKESALAQADFDKAKELGFGGFRKRDAANPLK